MDWSTRRSLKLHTRTTLSNCMTLVQANITTAAAEAEKSGLMWPIRVPLDAPHNVEAVREDEEAEMSSNINWNSKQPDVRTWRIAKSWSPKKRLGNVYSEWTSWTSCDEDCRQRRERFCNMPRKCSDTKHVVEERRCSMLMYVLIYVL